MERRRRPALRAGTIAATRRRPPFELERSSQQGVDPPSEPERSSQQVVDPPFEPGRSSQQVVDPPSELERSSQQVVDPTFEPERWSQHLDDPTFEPGRWSQHLDDPTFALERSRSQDAALPFAKGGALSPQVEPALFVLMRRIIVSTSGCVLIGTRVTSGCSFVKTRNTSSATEPEEDDVVRSSVASRFHDAHFGVALVTDVAPVQYTLVASTAMPLGLAAEAMVTSAPPPKPTFMTVPPRVLVQYTLVASTAMP